MLVVVMDDARVAIWSNPRLRTAAAGRDWARVLRLWRELTGDSQSRLGQRVGLSQPDISAIENGRRTVTSSEVITRIIEGLGVPSELSHQGTAVALSVGHSLPSVLPDPDLLDRVSRATSNPQRVDAATITWLEQMLAAQRKADDEVGWRPILAVVRHQLDVVADLFGGTRGPLADRIVRLAAEHAQFIAWLCKDSGNDTAAITWFDRAHGWAVEAGDADLAATTINMRAHVAWTQRDARTTIRLAEASRWHDGRTSPAVRGMAVQMVARGYALAGDKNQTRGLLAEAGDILAEAAENPAWMYFFSPSWFLMQRGMAEMDLRDWPQATILLERGLAGLPENYRRDRAWFSACLAHSRAQAGDAPGAVEAARESVAQNVMRPHTMDEIRKAAAATLRAGAPQGRDIIDLARTAET